MTKGLRYANLVAAIIASIAVIIEIVGLQYILGAYIIYWSHIFNWSIVVSVLLLLTLLLYDVYSSIQFRRLYTDNLNISSCLTWERIVLSAILVVLLASLVAFNSGLFDTQKKAILISKFNDNEGDGYKLSNVIYSHLSRSSVSNYFEIIGPRHNPPNITDSTDASRIGQYYNADLVLWGWYAVKDSAVISLNITLTDEFKKLKTKEKIFVKLLPMMQGVPMVGPRSNLASFEFQSSLSSYIEALSSFFLSIYLYKSNEYSKSAETIRYSEKVMPKSHTWERAYLFQFKSRLLHYGRDSTRKALRANGKALETNGIVLKDLVFINKKEGRNDTSKVSVLGKKSVDDSTTIPLSKYEMTTASPKVDLQLIKKQTLPRWASRILITRAEMLTEINNVVDARKSLRASLSIYETPLAWRKLALLFARNDDIPNNMNRALECIENGLNAGDEDYQMYLAKSDIHMMNDQPAEAYRSLAEAARVYPGKLSRSSKREMENVQEQIQTLDSLKRRADSLEKALR